MKTDTFSADTFKKTHILVIGDVMLDQYWQGDTTRISPEAPVPILHVTSTQERAGGAGNVALNLKALGCQVSLLGIIGKDEAGEKLENMLQTAGIQCYFHRVEGFPTITKLRVLGRHQQLIRLDFEKSFNLLELENLIPDVKKLIQNNINAVILSDYAKGTLHHAAALITEAKQIGIPVLVDPKHSDFNMYRGATIVTPNKKEFEAVVGNCSNTTDMIAKAYGLLQDYDLSALLVTQGEQGMTLIQQNLPPLHLPAQTREVYDVTGAGDTVIAVLAAAMAAKISLEEAARLSNVAGGLAVEKSGAVAISALELFSAADKGYYTTYLQKAKNNLHLRRGVLTEAALLPILQSLRDQGETIVMTNGCFDLLHAGHVQYLQDASALGQYLIVAVNDDASVQRLKGNKRPINPLSERMAVLAGLRAVDWVIPFSEDTPEQLIERIQPDILVKAEDYAGKEIAGAKYVLSKGGQVKLLPFKTGCSTTGIIGKIFNSIV